MASVASVASRRFAAATVLVALLAAGAAATPAWAAEVVVAEQYPLRGVATTITVSEAGAPLAGAEVEALYRPNSQTSFTETVGATDAAGRLSWVPRDAGIVTLSARPAGGGDTLAAHTVAVRYGGFPASGLTIMVVAGLLLFGGAALGLVELLRSDKPTPATEPPST